jgi:restriction system protein
MHRANQRFHKGFVTTTSDFAPRIKSDPLIRPLIPNRLDLINGDELLKRLTDIANESKK